MKVREIKKITPNLSAVINSFGSLSRTIKNSVVNVIGATSTAIEFKIAPVIPYIFSPTYVAVFSITGPGVIWDIESISLNCSGVNQLLERTASLIIPIIDQPPPNAINPIFTNSKKTLSTLYTSHLLIK